MKNIIQLLIIFFLSLAILNSQAQVRYIFKNTSAVNEQSYSDNEIYIYTQLGMPGMNGYFNTNSGNWESINTAGNMTGPDGNTYTDANVRLSDMPTNAHGQHYLDIPNGSSGRIYIGFGGPIYTVTANNPILDSPSNPNYYTKVETIELTIGGQIFTNTSRVDRYAYPMGEELYCSNGAFYDKVGETVTHEQVIAKWKLFVNDEFQNSYDPVRDIITQMGHTPYFQEGNPGNNYFETFIDELFAYYRNNTLRAEWNNTLRTATVNGNTMTWNDGTTFDRADFELENIIGAGAGSAFNNGIGQILGVCLNRGVVQLTTATQIWDEPNNFFQNPIKNDYTHFFHSDFVSFEGKTYALAYDDVFDQSSTQSCQGTPDSVVLSLGGYGTEHTQNLTNVYIDPQNPEVDQYKTFQLNVKGLDQGMIDMNIPNDAIITWTVLDPNNNPANGLITNNGLFGPTNTLGNYTITVEVQTNGSSYQASTVLKVVPAGTTGQACRGDAQANAEYKLEVIGQRVYLTLIPGPSWNNTLGYVRLFYGTNPNLGDMGANTLIPNQAYYMDGVFFGDQVYFYIFTEHNGGTPNGSPINILSLGTCDGLEVEEAIINLETPQNIEIEITDTYQIPVTGLTNKSNSFDYPNSIFTENIIFSGEGVDANGLFSPTTTGEFEIQITYNGIQITTTIKVINSACNNTLDLGPTQSVCENESLQIDIPAGTYSNITWSGSGAVFLDNTTSKFTGTSGNYSLTINATDESGCSASGSLDIEVNGKPNLSITYNSNSVCTYEGILTPTLSHGLGNITILPENGSINSNGDFDPNNSVPNTYSISYKYTDPTTTCEGDSSTFEITVNPRPTTDITNNPSTICEGSTPITLQSSPSGGVFTGLGITDTTLDLTGLSDAGNPYTITYNYQDPNTNCQAFETSLNYTLVNTPSPTFTNASELSNNVSDQNSVPEICATGTSIQWYQTNNTATTPIATTDCYTPAFTDITPTDGNMDFGVYSFYATQTISGCQSEPQKVTLTISNCPVAAPEVSNYHSCVGNTTIEVTAISSGGNIGWFLNEPTNPILGDEDFTGNSWDQHNLTNEGIHTLYAAVYDNINNCYGPLAATTINVHPLPEITIPILDTLCSSDNSPLDITFTPSNAILTGNGVINANQWDLQFDALMTGFTKTTLKIEATENHGNGNDVNATCNSETSFDILVAHATTLSGTGIEQLITHSFNQLADLPDMEINFNASSNAQLFIKDEANQLINPNNTSIVSLYPNHISSPGVFNYEISQSIYGCTSEPIISTWEIIECDTEAPEVSDIVICDNEVLPVLTPLSSGFNYEWTSSDGTILGTTTSLDLEQFKNTFPTTGDHLIYVSKEELDASNQLCRGAKKEVKITINPTPSIQIENNIICNRETLTLSPTLSNNSNATYSWIDLNQNQIVGSTKTLTVSPTSTTEYSIKVENDANCFEEKTLTINVIAQPRAEITSSDFILCNNELLTLTAFNDNSEAYTFNWFFGNSKNSLSPMSTSERISINKKGFYALEVTNDAKCITRSDTHEVTIESFEFYAEASAYSVSENEEITLYTTFTEGTGTTKWTTPNGIEQGNEIGYAITEDTRFYVSVQGEKCMDTSSVFVKVNKPFLIPNGFSPNGDGKNETWNISGLPSIPLNISIYNRWGSLVYEYPFAYTEPWRGTNQSGENLPLDTYYYVIRSNDDSLNLTGTITILK